MYAVANPLPGARAKVPLLEVKDLEQSPDTMLFTESLVVADYIAEQYDTKNHLLPASAKDRAITRLFTELFGGSAFSYFPLLRAKGDKLEAAKQTFKDGLVGANAFLKHHKSAPFLLGDQFSLAECNAAPFVQRACIILPAFTGPTNGVNPIDICDDLGLDHLKKWMEAVMARPSVIATGMSEEKLLEGTTKMLERLAAMEQT